MKNRLPALLGLVSLLGVTSAFGVIAQSNPTPTPPPAAGHHERHPEMIRALRALNVAKTALKNSSKDYQGHREKALDLTQQAIQEVQEALKSDKK